MIHPSLKIGDSAEVVTSEGFVLQAKVIDTHSDGVSVQFKGETRSLKILKQDTLDVFPKRD